MDDGRVFGMVLGSELWYYLCVKNELVSIMLKRVETLSSARK